jgi:uracil-DNA glycosylase family 4
MRDELLELTGALKDHIFLEKESGKDLSRLYLKGDLAVTSTVPAYPARKSGGMHVLPAKLEEVRAELGDCTRCKLHGGRHHIVFGEGNPQADLIFVGEAPGGDEDRQGRPFVGRAGQLLTDIIKAMRLTRDAVYICNILKCRPPGNRNPEPDEITACEPFLLKQLQSIQPRVICALGKFAAQTLLKTDTAISLLRGRFHSYHGIRLMPTYHPAYLLRNPGAKKQVWEDVQMIMKELQQGPQGGNTKTK